MNETTNITRTKRLTLLLAFAALAVVSTASAAVSGGLPPGKLCGSVSGAAWKYQGQTGTQYNVVRATGRVVQGRPESRSRAHEAEAARRRARPSHPHRPERLPLCGHRHSLARDRRLLRREQRREVLLGPAGQEGLRDMGQQKPKQRPTSTPVRGRKEASMRLRILFASLFIIGARSAPAPPRPALSAPVTSA